MSLPEPFCIRDEVVVDIPIRDKIMSFKRYTKDDVEGLLNKLETLADGKALSVNHSDLSNGNISSLHQEAGRRGLKFHCWSLENRRLLWVEKRN